MVLEYLDDRSMNGADGENRTLLLLLGRQGHDQYTTPANADILVGVEPTKLVRVPQCFSQTRVEEESNLSFSRQPTMIH